MRKDKEWTVYEAGERYNVTPDNIRKLWRNGVAFHNARKLNPKKKTSAIIIPHKDIVAEDKRRRKMTNER